MDLLLAARLFDWQAVLVSLAILPPVLLANYGLTSRTAKILTLLLLVLAILVVTAGGFGYLITGLGSRAGGARPGLIAAGAVTLLAAAIGAALLVVPSDRLGRLLAGRIPVASASVLDMAALVGVVLLVGEEIGFQLTTDALSKVTGAPALDRWDVFFGEVPLLLAALLGVGLFTRRSPREVVQRIGWVRPAWWQVVLGLASSGVFFMISQLGDQLQRALTPDLSHRLGDVTQHLYGGLGDPIGIALIALSAGIAEEALFRGALQPRLGLALVAIAFTAVHAQYGISFDTLVVLVLGTGLGLLRRYANTTTSTITHVGYNALAGLSLSGVLLFSAVALEGVLAALLVVAATPALARRRNRVTGEPELGEPRLGP